MENKQIRILAIDDNPDNLISLKALLKDAFPRSLVFTVLNGQKGLEMAASEDPDVILLDIIMPVMDGYEVCRRLKANSATKEIPVVFVTAIKSDKNSRILALESGAEAFLAKPIDQSELTAQIRAMFKIKEANIKNRDEKQRLAALVEEKTSELKKENEARRKSEMALLKSEEKYRQIAENVSDVIWILDIQKDRFTYISPSIFNLRGITVEEAISESVEEALTSKSIVVAKDFISKCLNDLDRNHNESKTYIYEVQKFCKNGEVVWVEESIKSRYNSNGEIEVLGISRNIDLRKKQERELKYMSFHDHLTGLYNRRYFEDELRRLDIEANLPMTIVMGDVNGLKLVNDSFGHAAGDEILKKTAEIIGIVCRANDIIARLGGDEFVVLLPKTDSIEAEQIIKQIDNILSTEKVANLDHSISFGYGTKRNKSESIQEVLIKAEDSMYRFKFYENKSLRSKTIDLIMNALVEKSSRELMHSKRVSTICETIATKLNFKHELINQVRIAGLVHDIGKIGIDEKILNKTSSLDTNEWEAMKKHPEAGLRILNSVNEFSELAELVFSHHERWDGRGYPRRLKAEEIPIEARIITVADSYDAMTSERSYQKKMSQEQAANEIKRCSGKQFDPEIAKVFIEKVLGKPWD